MALHDNMTWEEIEKEMEHDNEEIRKLVELLSFGHTTFRHRSNGQEGCVHPCLDAKYLHQFTYFDKNGPVGDFRRYTLEELAQSIREYGFEACSKEQLLILT